MLLAINKTYNLFTDVLDAIQITHTKFFHWIDRCKTYGELNKANKFIHSQFYMKLCAAGSVWARLPKKDWSLLRKIDRGCKDVRDLNYVFHEVRMEWGKRPKMKRESE